MRAGGRLSSRCSAPAGLGLLLRRREASTRHASRPAKASKNTFGCRSTPPCREGVTVSPNEATAGARLQRHFPERALHRLNEVCRDATPGVACARACPPVPECVPVSYPRGRDGTPTAGNITCRLAGSFCRSPLTDSNRRPPLYEEGPWVKLRCVSSRVCASPSHGGAAGGCGW